MFSCWDLTLTLLAWQQRQVREDRGVGENEEHNTNNNYNNNLQHVFPNLMLLHVSILLSKTTLFHIVGQ